MSFMPFMVNMKQHARKSPRGTRKTARSQPLRQLIATAMELERRTMQLYCRFETQFSKPDEVRSFWLDMAQHESRHVGALALVAGLLEVAPGRQLTTASALTRKRLDHLRGMLTAVEREAEQTVALPRAFEMALEIEGSEI